jgi:hypothetical protein
VIHPSFDYYFKTLSTPLSRNVDKKRDFLHSRNCIEKSQDTRASRSRSDDSMAMSVGAQLPEDKL